jgi:hypothetical protein
MIVLKLAGALILLWIFIQAVWPILEFILAGIVYSVAGLFKVCVLRTMTFEQFCYGRGGKPRKAPEAAAPAAKASDPLAVTTPRCPRCGFPTEWLQTEYFCLKCGWAGWFMQEDTCACGKLNPTVALFCTSCGRPLQRRALK